MRLLRGLLPLLPVLLVAAGIPAAGKEAAPPAVIGYYPSWTDVLPVGQIRYGQFTHLIHAFVTLQKGALHTSGNLPSHELTHDAHAAGVKVLLGLGGENSGAELSAMTRDPDAEKACIAGLAKLVADHGYDGVDVDWEFPTAADTSRVVPFIARLRQELRRTNPGALVTMPLPNTDHYGQYFDGPRLAPLLDLALIMTYNVHGPWKADDHTYSHAGFDSPLKETTLDPIDGRQSSYEKSIEYWRTKGFADRQLVVGIHFSGHGFMAKKWGDIPTTASSHADIEHRAIGGLLAAGWKRKWDPQANVPWLESPAGLPAELITYDDAESVELKAAWAREAGLRGVFFWEITEDYIQNRNELVEAARRGLKLPGAKSDAG